MKYETNHEGYHDPTAYRAIRRAEGQHCKNCTAECLRYQIGELRSFRRAVRALTNRG